MKLHESTIKRLINLFHLWGGDGDKEKRLLRKLSELDLSVYKQMRGNEIIVLTEDLMKHK